MKRCAMSAVANPSHCFDQGWQIPGVNDFTRSNITRFPRRMDSSRHDLFINDGSGYRKTFGGTVCHMNPVVKYVSGEGENYNRFRIILNRRGIKRIESVDKA